MKSQRLRWWAVSPTAQPEAIRIEKAKTAIEAVRLTFGRPTLQPRYLVGKYRTKDLGTTVALIHNDKQRLAAMRDPANWFDPYQPKGAAS
jgi:hypothetical protein